MNGNKLEVTFHGQTVGTLSETVNHRIAFAYTPEWLRDGFPISPFSLPLKQDVFVPSALHFGGLFGVFADSLPDAWGQLLMNRMLKGRRINTDEVGPLTQLAIIGSSGMGALCYQPAWETWQVQELNDLDELAQECQRILNREEMEFRYRHSAVMDSGDIILGATLELTRDDPDAIRERISELTRKRVSKQPLNFPSAGSTFKRPPGYFAAALIDQAGLRGYRVGDAQVSEKHTGFVVNRGHATASEILQLMDDVREKVHAMSGVWLEPEVRIIGEK